MKQRKFNDLADLGSKAGKNAIFGRKRVRVRTVITEKVIPGQPYEPTLNQKIRLLKQELAAAKKAEQPASKQALLYYFLGEPRYATASERNMSILNSTGWKYEIVEVDYNMQLREL